MRTRSSRFFVILLHLLGVSHYYYDYPSGRIVPVQPWPIVLEKLNFLLEEEIRDEEPFWLQDVTTENSCLGPTATFSECGDATLWYVKRTTIAPPSRRSLLAGLFFIGGAPPGLVEDDSDKEVSATTVWKFQVVDRDFTATTTTSDKNNDNDEANKEKRRKRWRRRNREQRRTQAECLMHATSSSGSRSTEEPMVKVQSACRAAQASWRVDEAGLLFVHDKANDSERSLCLARENQSAKAVLVPCAVGGNDVDTMESEKGSDAIPVRLSLLRYRAVPASATVSSVQADANGLDGTEPSSETIHKFNHGEQNNKDKKNNKKMNNNNNNKISKIHEEDEEQEEEDHLGTRLFSSKDKAHSQAREPALHPDLKQSDRLLFSHPALRKEKDNSQKPQITPLHVLGDTNPILFLDKKVGGKPSLVSQSGTPPVRQEEHTYKSRRLVIHPYIAAAKNEVWTDPQTGLDYRTDLCRYLGLSRQEHGRQTLMGVGQYRKGYVIKIYGIGFYISKRDVLADPAFKQYAGLSADELRRRPDFYELLRSKTGQFDRTLLLKTNMQLSAETMRNSLQADWQYLTEEAKELLVKTSLEPRPADDEMLRFIQSPDNPSRCSCSQVAPPEYQADPQCCARGTELVFTWRKSGHLEVRLNGRMVESFPRIDIAEGIFYEYLRTDDPMSPELIERVVDGFPFLLAPLDHVRGVKIGQQLHSKATEAGNPIFRALGGFADTVSVHATELSGAFQRSMSEVAINVGNAARDSAALVSRELERRKDFLVKQASVIPSTLSSILARDQDAMRAVAIWVGVNETPTVQEPEPTRKISQGRAFGYPLSRWFSESYYAPDEIGPMKIHPTMNTTRKLFLALVHLYLLLLFIVSFPGSYTTKTKLIVRQSCVSRELSDSESESSDDEPVKVGGDHLKDIVRRPLEKLNCQEFSFQRGTRIRQPLRSEEAPVEFSVTGSPLKKKSLSYFL